MITYTTDKLQKVLLSGGCVQNGVPTPNNPIDIVCNNGVVKVSKNLFDKNTMVLDANVNANYVIDSSTTSEYNKTIVVPVEPDTTYTVKRDLGESTQRFRVAVSNSSTNPVFYLSCTAPADYYLISGGATFTTKSDTKWAVIWIASRTAGASIEQVDYAVDTCQLETGTVPTPYRPYGQIYVDGTQEVVTDNVGNTANAERLLAIGNYKDTQSVLDGSVTRNVGIKVLDGTENWTLSLSSYEGTDRNLFYTSISDSLGDTMGICSIAPFTTAATYTVPAPVCRLTTTKNLNIIPFSDTTTIPTVDAWKQYLVNQYANGTPVIVVYPLAEHTTEQVTPQPLAGNSVTQTAGSIDNLPIESSTIAELKNRYIGTTPVGRVYICDNLVWETKEGYGVRWVHDGDGTITRIGNMEYHRTLPIQSKMKRCILTSTGVVRYVDDNDYTKDTSGNTIDYTADNQDVMVEIPEHYYEAGQVTEDNVTYDYIMLYPSVRLGKRVPKHYIGAFEAMTKNNNNSPESLWSTCKTNIVYEQDGSVDLGSLTYTNDAADYRGGNRNSSTYGDATAKSLLGKPATNINITNFANYGIARGDGYAMINWASWNSLLRLYVVEYANFDSQATYNSSLTADGYRQGGLGAGVSNINDTYWSSLLAYNPFIPCGVTLSLGSNTGTVKCTLPSELSNMASNTYVPSYRGVENPFGHIWQMTNGISIYGSGTNYLFRDNGGINTRAFTAVNSTTTPSGFTKVNSTTPLNEGWISTISFDENGEFTPKTVLTGQSNTQDTLSPFRDYFWGANSGAKRLIVGGRSNNGVRAGLFCFGCYSAVSSVGASGGSRLRYVNND